MRLTIAVPSAHIDIANHYAMALGYSAADGETYRNPSWQDADGNLYAVASLPIGVNFISAATTALHRPAWDGEGIIDMTKAAQAQAVITLWVPNDEGTTPPKATKSRITAILGMDGADALAAMGLTAINDEVNQ